LIITQNKADKKGNLKVPTLHKKSNNRLFNSIEKTSRGILVTIFFINANYAYKASPLNIFSVYLGKEEI